MLVFEADSSKEGGGSARDAYTLTRVVRVFAVDLVELKPAEGPDYRWVGGHKIFSVCVFRETRSRVNEQLTTG